MLQFFRVKYNLTLNDMGFNARKRESAHPKDVNAKSYKYIELFKCAA